MLDAPIRYRVVDFTNGECTVIVGKYKHICEAVEALNRRIIETNGKCDAGLFEYDLRFNCWNRLYL